MEKCYEKVISNPDCGPLFNYDAEDGWCGCQLASSSNNANCDQLLQETKYYNAYRVTNKAPTKAPTKALLTTTSVFNIKPCGSYCNNPCANFSGGEETILECSGCDGSYKCNPNASNYGVQYNQNSSSPKSLETSARDAQTKAWMLFYSKEKMLKQISAVGTSNAGDLFNRYFQRLNDANERLDKNKNFNDSTNEYKKIITDLNNLKPTIKNQQTKSITTPKPTPKPTPKLPSRFRLLKERHRCQYMDFRSDTKHLGDGFSSPKKCYEAVVNNADCGKGFYYGPYSGTGTCKCMISTRDGISNCENQSPNKWYDAYRVND